MYAVYHWATITGGKWGRPIGYFAGWWNFLAWVFGAASTSSILANQTVAMYSLKHPDFVAHPWHTFVSFIICTWLCCFVVLFANRALPMIENIGGFFILSGVLIVIIVAAVMPTVTGNGHATNDFVWKDWQNLSGYSSNGFVFVAGMLNGAFAVGTPDCVSHLAEEIKNPSKNIPRGIMVQLGVGFFTAFFYMISLFYSVYNLDSVFTSVPIFPLAGLYQQAAGSSAGAVGLLVVTFLPAVVNCIGCYITAGRTFWSMARDHAVPGSRFFGKTSTTFGNPFNATILVGVICTILAAIQVGNTTAFNAFVGSFIVLSTLSYLAAIMPHMLSGRKGVVPGWFWMKGPLGFIVNGVSCLYIMAFIVIFCFPAAMPFNAATMNYTCLITGGLSIFVAIFWFFIQKEYEGPKNNHLEEAELT